MNALALNEHTKLIVYDKSMHVGAVIGRENRTIFRILEDILNVCLSRRTHPPLSLLKARGPLNRRPTGRLFRSYNSA